MEMNSFSTLALSSNAKEGLTIEKHVSQISNLLDEVVEDQISCDVPFGVFLSGGVDSSLIAAKASRLSTNKIKTFTIGFKDLSKDESGYARKIAKHLGTEHHEFFISANDALESLVHYQSIYDEPFADSSGIPTMMVSRLASQSVKMVLSGEGADELFLGYGSYQWANRLSNPIVWHSRKMISNLLRLSPKSRMKRVSEIFDVSTKSSLRSHIFSQEQYYFSKNEIIRLLEKSEFDSNYFLYSLDYSNQRLRHFLGGNFISSIEEQSLFDLQFYLPEDLLVKVDRASMKYSLETRVPYLDNRILDYLTKLPSKLKMEGGHKYILKLILSNYFPEEFFKRPKKGFSVPMNNWLRHELKYLFDDYLSKRVIDNFGIFNYNEVKLLISRFNSGEDYLYQRLWLLINLNMWLDKNYR
jgi:asparagine synthase (glutamine-hydrolysing)